MSAVGSLRIDRSVMEPAGRRKQTGLGSTDGPPGFKGGGEVREEAQPAAAPQLGWWLIVLVNGSRHEVPAARREHPPDVIAC